MERDALLQKLRDEGVNIEPVRLLSWGTRKLMPTCYARDGSVHWPDEAWWQAVAAAYMLDTSGFIESDVRLGRFYMEEPLLSGKSLVAELNRLERMTQQSNGVENYEAAAAWVISCIKAQRSWPLLAPAVITVRHGDTGGLRFDLDKSPDGADLLSEDGVDGRHPVTLFLE